MGISFCPDLLIEFRASLKRNVLEACVNRTWCNGRWFHLERQLQSIVSAAVHHADREWSNRRNVYPFPYQLSPLQGLADMQIRRLLRRISKNLRMHCRKPSIIRNQTGVAHLINTIFVYAKGEFAMNINAHVCRARLHNTSENSLNSKIPWL